MTVRPTAAQARALRRALNEFDGWVFSPAVRGDVIQRMKDEGWVAWELGRRGNYVTDAGRAVVNTERTED